MQTCYLGKTNLFINNGHSDNRNPHNTELSTMRGLKLIFDKTTVT